jgi:hypothetical protein
MLQVFFLARIKLSLRQAQSSYIQEVDDVRSGDGRIGVGKAPRKWREGGLTPTDRLARRTHKVRVENYSSLKPIMTPLRAAVRFQVP